MALLLLIATTTAAATSVEPPNEIGNGVIVLNKLLQRLEPETLYEYEIKTKRKQIM